MKLKERIEGILQKYGVATKMVTTGSTNDPISTWYTQDLAVEVTTADIIDYVQKIMGNGTMVVETVNESILVKLMEIIGKHMPIEKSYRDIDKDFKWYLEDKNSTNKEKNKTGLISKRAVKVAINNAFKDAFNGYFLDANLTVAENVIANKEGVRERLKRLHKSINKMPVIATDELFKETIMTKSTKNTTKNTALNIAKYFLWKANQEGKPITNKKLQKLVYYSQAWNLVLKGKPLYKDDIEAWVQGPVIKSVYDYFKKYTYNPITLKLDATITEKVPNKDILDEVWRVYGKLDADYLESLTHNEKPWQEAREHLSPQENSSITISLDSMQSYYSSLLNGGNKRIDI